MENNEIKLSFNSEKAAALKPASAPTEHEKEGGV